MSFTMTPQEREAFLSDVHVEGSVLVRMRPEKWLSNDQSKT
jgi:hypothetical protein